MAQHWNDVGAIFRAWSDYQLDDWLGAIVKDNAYGPENHDFR